MTKEAGGRRETLAWGTPERTFHGAMGNPFRFFSLWHFVVPPSPAFLLGPDDHIRTVL